MNVAIVGTGIAGLSCARNLHPDCSVTLFEAGDQIGGHARTITVDDGEQEVMVDVGVGSYFPPAYPKLNRLLSQFGTPTRDVDWSFAIRDDRGQILTGDPTHCRFFFDLGTLLRPVNLSCIPQVHRFRLLGQRYLDRFAAEDVDFGQFIDMGRFSRRFIQATIGTFARYTWSVSHDELRSLSARYVLDVMNRWSFLTLRRRHPWQCFVDGSISHINALAEPFRDRIHLRSPVTAVTRDLSGVTLEMGGQSHTFDAVVIAVGAPLALRLLTDARSIERDVLGAFDYKTESIVAHAENGSVPSRSLSASLDAEASNGDVPNLQLNLTKAFGLATSMNIILSLGGEADVPDEHVLHRAQIHIPMFTCRAVRAQQQHDQINGPRTFFCGAYWGDGFHEAGLRSGERAAASVCQHYSQ